MTAPGSAGRRALAARLAGIGLLAAGVSVALYVAGRLHTPDATSALFGFTVPIAAHCLFTYGVQYGVQLTSPRLAVHSLAGCFFLRRLRRQGAPGAQQAAARLGAAGCRGHARGCRRRAVVHIGAVILQRLPAPGM
jgi:Family of unknown function (DUF6529)